MLLILVNDNHIHNTNTTTNNTSNTHYNRVMAPARFPGASGFGRRCASVCPPI